MKLQPTEGIDRAPEGRYEIARGASPGLFSFAAPRLPFSRRRLEQEWAEIPNAVVWIFPSCATHTWQAERPGAG